MSQYVFRTFALCIDTDEETGHYLASSARIRRVSRSALLQRVVEVVLRDQLILSILDDDSEPMILGRRTRVPAPSVVP